MTYRGIARGKTIELEKPVPYPSGQAVTVSVEPCASATPSGSPSAVRQAMTEPPHPDPRDVDELEQAIAEGALPVRSEGEFDR
jgi:hypothetical protein